MKRFALTVLTLAVTLAAPAMATGPAADPPLLPVIPVVGTVIEVRPAVRDFFLRATVSGIVSMFRVSPATRVTVPAVAGDAAPSTVASVRGIRKGHLCSVVAHEGVTESVTCTR